MAEGGREPDAFKGNMQVGDGGISNTVEVRGFSIKTSQELMELYFENSRRSGGGAVEEVKIRDDVAYITFKEAEVAQKVVSRGNHQVDGHTLTVTLFHPLPPKPCYQNRVLIQGLNIAITEELLRNFLETKTKAQVTEFLYGEEDGNVVVTLSDNIDIVQLGKIFQECSIEGVFLKVARIAISNCILVQNLQPSTSHDVILYYFENKRSGGGDIERVEMKTEERYCLIYFEDPSVTDRVLGQSHNVDGVDFEVHLHHECLGQRSLRKKSDLYLRMSSPGNKDIATLKDEDTDNQTKDKTSSSVSSNPEKESDFVEVQEWQENDGNNCTLPLWIKYKRAPDMKFIKCMKNIPCSWNFHLYWNFFTKSEPGKQMLHEILNKYNCSVAVVAEDEDLFIFEISEKIFEQESDVVQLIHVVLDSVHKCAQQFLYLDNLLVDQRIQGDVLQVVRQRKELDIARFELMGQQDVGALCVICTEKDHTLVLHVVTEIIHKVKECFENHEETIHVDHKWQKVMKTFGYLQKLCEKYPSVTIISDKTEPAIMLKGLRDESKPAADHYLELLGTASSEVQEEIFSPGCQFEIFSYPEMCGYIDSITMELSIVWIPNHQTKKIHLFFKRSEKIKGVDKFIRGCVQERLYPLAKDQTVISTKIFRSLEELKKMHTGKIVFSLSHRGLLLTATDDIFDSIDDAVQEIICKETELQISRVHEEAEGVRTKTTVAERAQFLNQSNENEDRADTTVNDLQPSANGSNVDALSLVKPQIGESPDGSNAGAGIIKTPDANVTQTDSLSDKRKNMNELEGAQDVLPGHTVEEFLAVNKHFYLYLPYKHSDIKAVIMKSNFKELDGKTLDFISDSKYLWEVKVRLNPNIMDKQGTCYFVVEWKSYWSKPSRGNAHKIDSSTIQRIFLSNIMEPGFLCHAQHIIQHCHEDMKDSILQMEALVIVVSSSLNKSNFLNVVKGLQEDNVLSDSRKCLMLGVLIGYSKDLQNLVKVIDNNVLQLLLHALCQLKRTDVPSSCISCLHKLSYFVMQRKYGKEFCLIHWMTDMFPFLDESIFLKEIELFNRNSKAIKTLDDEKTADLTMNLCTVIQDRIKQGKSGNGPELLRSLMKHLPLSAVMKVYSLRIDREADFKDIKEKILDGLVSEIIACALTYYKESNISRLRYLWDHVKGESYAQLLTDNFEKHILSLLQKTDSLNDDYVALFQDEILFVKNQEDLLSLIAKSPTRAIHGHMKALAQLSKYMPVIGTVAETWLETAITKHMSSHSANSQQLISMYSYLWDAIIWLKVRNDEKLVQRLENKLYNTKVKYMKTDNLLEIADPIISTSRDAELAQDIFQQHFMRLLKDQHGSEDTVKILIGICGRDICISAM